MISEFVLDENLVLYSKIYKKASYESIELCQVENSGVSAGIPFRRQIKQIPQRTGVHEL